MLNEEDRALLSRIARAAVRAEVDPGSPAPALPGDRLTEPGSAFVTLKRRGRLRGCIGLIGERFPLAEAVAQASRRSTRDPRFPAVSADELDELTVQVTVLGPFRDLEDPADLEVGRHGIYVTRGGRSGLLLPQVATEQGWDRETFLSHGCLKAGLGPDDWREPDTVVQVFEGEVF